MRGGDPLAALRRHALVRRAFSVASFACLTIAVAATWAASVGGPS